MAIISSSSGLKSFVFDGSSYVLKGSDSAGNADGDSGILYLEFKVGAINSNMLMIASAGSRFFARKEADNTVVIKGLLADATIVLDIRTTATFTDTNTWVKLLASWDLSAGDTHLFIDDVSDNNEVAADAGDIDYTRVKWSIGAGTTGATLWTGELGSVWFAPNQYLDFSVEANRRKFISPSLGRVDLGIDGSKPLGGTPPLVYMPVRGSSTTYNAGTGGDFTASTGTVVYIGVLPGEESSVRVIPHGNFIRR